MIDRGSISLDQIEGRNRGRKKDSLMSKSNLANYKYRGAVALLSKPA